MSSVVEQTQSLQMTPEQLDEERGEQKEHITVVDFKMVTFSLAGKDYAIDIMKVKEIAKAGRFTYVPNTSPFVLGVYNLRGDIIPIIDLRLFFNIDIPERKNDQLENMLIVSVEDQTFGVVVDVIDKVVGIQRSSIQPPHPLFGDINIKYIYGVVESNNRLYILLDIDRIFGVRVSSRVESQETENTENTEQSSATTTAQNTLTETVKTTTFNTPPEFKEASHESSSKATGYFSEKKEQEPQNVKQSVLQESYQSSKSDTDFNNDIASNNSVAVPSNSSVQSNSTATESNKVAVADDYSFIVESLATLKKFYVTSLNEQWIRRRFTEWEQLRAPGDVQLHNVADADQFLSSFTSPFSGSFWSKEYADAIFAALPDNTAKQITVWNPGCGKGYEAFSLACILKKRYPEARIRVYAHDIDLICVSNAPLLIVPPTVAEGWYAPYVTKTVSGDYGFSSEIKDMILFEYHDCVNANAMPTVDILFCRDMLSYLSEEAQETLFEDFEDKLKGNGIIILGENESLTNRVLWSERMVGSIVVYGKQ